MKHGRHSLPYLRCANKEEVNYVLQEIQEGICNNHAGARSLVRKWITLQKDAYDLFKACDQCQCFANVQTRPSEPMTPITTPWPFTQWGIDIMGPLPIGKKQYKFLIVEIDYFTKWVEAKPTVTITEAKVTSFVWKNIVCKFEIPNVIISDNGKQFNYPKFQKIC